MIWEKLNAELTFKRTKYQDDCEAIVEDNEEGSGGSADLSNQAFDFWHLTVILESGWGSRTTWPAQCYFQEQPWPLAG
jgi:hypothetical protein